MSDTDYYQKCRKCGTIMHGIRSFLVGLSGKTMREFCEKCGGNKTKFNKDNMHPQCEHRFSNKKY